MSRSFLEDNIIGMRLLNTLADNSKNDSFNDGELSLELLFGKRISKNFTLNFSHEFNTKDEITEDLTRINFIIENYYVKIHIKSVTDFNEGNAFDITTLYVLPSINRYLNYKIKLLTKSKFYYSDDNYDTRFSIGFDISKDTFENGSIGVEYYYVIAGNYKNEGNDSLVNELDDNSSQSGYYLRPRLTTTLNEDAKIKATIGFQISMINRPDHDDPYKNIENSGFFTNIDIDRFNLI